MFNTAPQDIRIPKLRQDLRIEPSGHDMDGSPQWIIYDPLADNYFSIGWFEFECIKRFGACKTIKSVVKKIKEETTLDPDLEDVQGVVNFLLLNKLFSSDDPSVKLFLQTEYDREKPNFLTALIKKYLFFRLPLFKPHLFLKKTYPYVAPLFSQGFLYTILALLSVGIFLTAQRLDEFMLTFTGFFNVEGVIMVVLSTVLVKFCHEMGHAFMATKYRVPVSSMGVAMIVLYPIFYTETTNAWRLFDRRKRINIAAAGLMAELALASVALILWHVLPAGFGQNMAFFVAFLSLAASVFVNLNPLMKFDGYYLFSDMIGVPNLQDRSIWMMKWRLRRLLFNLDDPAPEAETTRQGRFLGWFGLALVIYRFFLFLGIAFLVYHVFMKPLGLILMFLELFWFIALPVWNEVFYWWQERERIFANMRGWGSVILATLVLIAMFLPLRNTVKMPAVMHSAQYFTAYSPVKAVVDQVYVQNYQNVEKNTPLLRLKSPELEFESNRIAAELALYQELRERTQISPDLMRKEITIDEKINELQTQFLGVQRLKEGLLVTAPFDGVVRDLGEHVHLGRHVSEELALLRVIRPEQVILTAYSAERDVSRLRSGQEGKFYTNTDLFGGVPVSVTEVAQNDTRDVVFGELLSVFGGAIPSDPSDEGKMGAVARNSMFFVGLSPVGQEMNRALQAERVRHGVVFVESEAISIAGRLFESLVSLFVKEVSF